MDEYWKDLYDSLSKTPGKSLLEQVGKTLNGKALPEGQVALIASSAAKVLNLSHQDMFIDLCCGNGVITERLAPLVAKAWGIDFSEGLIEVAKNNSNAANVEYVHGDVLNLEATYFSGTKKVLMNEALQHFSTEDLNLLLMRMTRLGSGSRIYFGGIPDREKIDLFYDTPEKRAFYESREREGRPHSGRWWTRSEIADVAADHGFKVTIVAQSPMMVTSYYRFDVLLER